MSKMSIVKWETTDLALYRYMFDVTWDEVGEHEHQ